MTKRIFSDRLYLIERPVLVTLGLAYDGFRQERSLLRGDAVKARGYRHYVVGPACLEFGGAGLDQEVRVNDGHLPEFQPRMTVAEFLASPSLWVNDAVLTGRYVSAVEQQAKQDEAARHECAIPWAHSAKRCNPKNKRAPENVLHSLLPLDADDRIKFAEPEWRSDREEG